MRHRAGHILIDNLVGGVKQLLTFAGNQFPECWVGQINQSQKAVNDLSFDEALPRQR